MVSFGDILNKSLQKEQMDLLLKFWDNELNKVVRGHYTSVFLGRITADDLLHSFRQCLLSLNS